MSMDLKLLAETLSSYVRGFRFQVVSNTAHSYDYGLIGFGILCTDEARILNDYLKTAWLTYFFLQVK